MESLHKPRKLIVADVCDTLFHSNTTFDFIGFVLARRNRLRYFLFVLLTHRFSPACWAMVITGRIFSVDYARGLAILLLKGFEEHGIDALARQFYDSFLVEKMNLPAHRILTDGEALRLLASSSIEPVVRVIGEKLQVAFVSSRLVVKDGLLTGRLSLDLTGQKHDVVRRWMTENGISVLAVITDNRSDYKLVEMAMERWVVVRKETDLDFWRPLNPHFLRYDNKPVFS